MPTVQRIRIQVCVTINQKKKALIHSYSVIQFSYIPELVRLFSKEEKVHSKVIFDAAFVRMSNKIIAAVISNNLNFLG